MYQQNGKSAFEFRVEGVPTHNKELELDGLLVSSSPNHSVKLRQSHDLETMEIHVLTCYFLFIPSFAYWKKVVYYMSSGGKPYYRCP